MWIIFLFKRRFTVAETFLLYHWPKRADFHQHSSTSGCYFEQFSIALCSWQLSTLLRMLTKLHIMAEPYMKLNIAQTLSHMILHVSKVHRNSVCSGDKALYLKSHLCKQAELPFIQYVLQIRTKQLLEVFKCPSTNPQTWMWCKTQLKTRTPRFFEWSSQAPESLKRPQNVFSGPAKAVVPINFNKSSYCWFHGLLSMSSNSTMEKYFKVMWL